MSTDLQLTGSVVVITGSAGGIGSAAVNEFQDAGATVVAVDVDQSALSELARSRPGIDTRVCNIADESAVHTLVADVITRHGRIDTLYNNASIEGEIAPIVESTLDGFIRTMSINVTSVYLTMRAVLPHMIELGSGSIINVGSTAATRGTPTLSGYTASKHAVLGLTRAVAGEVASSGVRVNAICPGPTHTRMMSTIEHLTNPADPSAVRGGWEAAIPRGTYAQPSEIARIALFLASPLASNVTGAAWAADGGATAV